MSAIPQLSIGLPVYNAERYLREALDSLLAQTYADFEVIVCDNASTDTTPQICEEYRQKDSRVRCHRHPENLGSVANFNSAFELAQGTYFKWAAYDDLHHETYLEKCVALLEADPQVMWAHSLTVHIDSDGQVVPPAEDPNLLGDQTAHSLLYQGDGLPQETRSSCTPAQRFAGVLLGTTWCSDAYAVYRSEALRKTRLLLPCYGAEKILMGELSLLGRFAEVPEPLFFERIHGEASAALRTTEQQQQFILGAGASRFGSTRWKLLAGHVGSFLRVPLPLTSRLACAVSVLKYIGQVRKWKTILSQTLTQTAVGTERRTHHETAAV